MSSNNAAERIEEIMWNNRSRKELAAAIIEGAARQLGQTVQVDWTSLVFGKKGIHEKTASRTLSTRICDLMHPHVPSGEFFHYTKMEGFTGIMGSGVLRLGQLLKRIASDGAAALRRRSSPCSKERVSRW